jgi:hypothetical protein
MLSNQVHQTLPAGIGQELTRGQVGGAQLVYGFIWQPFKSIGAPANNGKRSPSLKLAPG